MTLCTVCGTAQEKQAESCLSPFLKQIILEVAKATDETNREQTVAAFSAVLRQQSLPLLEGNLVTFVWLAEQKPLPSAVEVFGDFTGWQQRCKMQQIAGCGIYFYTLTDVPQSARIEYKFSVAGQDMLDSANAQKIDNGIGGENSVLAMPGYKPLTIVADKDTPSGTVTSVELKSEIMQNSRAVHVYTPAGYDTAAAQKYPVLYIHDGTQYLRRTQITAICDHLMYKGRIAKIIMVFVDPVDRQKEYAGDAGYTRFVLEELLPFVRKNYHASELPSENAVMGASMGGHISLHLCFTHPEVFGMMASQSGAFAFINKDILDNLQNAERKTIRIYMDIGLYDLVGEDGSLLQDNRNVEKILQAKRYDYFYQEFSGGHSWTSWRDQLVNVLEFLFKK
jgi:enterochelin esterase family protein